MNDQKVRKASEKNAALQTLSAQDIGMSSTYEKVSPIAMAVYVRSLLQNWRQGTVACKGRSDVAYSNKKPWKQKGTGRARAGSARSPLWRGGGVIFGPQPRTRVLKTSKQVKKNVLGSLLHDFIMSGKVVSLNWDATLTKPSTAQAFNALKSSGLHQERIVLFLPTNDIVSYASFANIPSVRILYFDQPNAFDLANGSRWLILNKDVEHFKKMVSQWI
jgi:large subunit ribosomal protein L4